MNNKYLSPSVYAAFLVNKSQKTILPFIRPLEKYLEKYFSNKYGINGSLEYPPIFLVGAPRTGSTILYQVITNFWRVGYINNLECMYNTIIVTISLLSHIIYREKCHNSFKSYHGKTEGLNAPSECGTFWYRWFPRYKHFVERDELSKLKQKEIRSVVKSLIKIKNKPFIFKNMNCGLRIRALFEIFPEAIFIYSRRDPFYVAQSMAETRKRIYGNYDTWWSVMPKEYSSLLSLDPAEQIVAQVYYIEKQIDEDLNTFFKDRYMEIRYESFCEEPKELIDKIRTFLADLGVRIGEKKEPDFSYIRNTNRITLASSFAGDLRRFIKKYYY